jgi:hypothetical protein
MSSSISTLLTRNLHDVFGENDPARRRAAKALEEDADVELDLNGRSPEEFSDVHGGPAGSHDNLGDKETPAQPT